MAIDYQKLRLFGVYQQDKDDNLMLRVKVPAGFFSTEQAERLCLLSEQFSNSILHLTCRGSIEFHWLRHEHLDELFASLGLVGLTTRGACGGAVRGISCSTTFAPGYAAVQHLAQQINQHFAGNPEFEGLPKKFKVGIDADYHGSRYLIQDIGLVLVGTSDGEALFDIWCAGGLGREPQAAFLFEKAVPEKRLIPLIEAVVQVYRANTPPPKRLKYLLNTIGEAEFRRLLQLELPKHPQPTLREQASAADLQAPEGVFLEIPVFAGEITVELLRKLASVAAEFSSGHLAVTADQNIAILTAHNQDSAPLHEALQRAGIRIDEPGIAPRFRVCPGNHECRMGLVPTREVARQATAAMDRATSEKRWAVSGCRNSCTQPQLADYGIVTKKLHKSENGDIQPLFDLFHRDGEGLGRCIGAELTTSALHELIRTLK
jgi:sulfite reductase beta subunit-like hemoprotein